MARPRIISETIEDILHNRVNLAVSTGLFSRADIMKSWSLSSSTFYRYLSSIRRDASVEYSRIRYQLTPKRDVSICEGCKAPVESHKKCDHCDCLLHGETTVCSFCTNWESGKINAARMLGLVHD